MNHPSEVVAVGDKVEVQVLDVDMSRERISLGLKQTQDDPWKQLVKEFQIGAIMDGKVTKIVPFGAFVEIGNNVEGLVHISEMARGHVEKPEDVVNVGDEIKIKIMDVDIERRRISLSIRAANEELGLPDAVPDDSEDAEEGVEFVAVDMDGDGTADAVIASVDLDDDGDAETVVIGVDSDGDGEVDAVLTATAIDTDGDGEADTIIATADLDGDGEIDVVEVITADEAEGDDADGDDAEGDEAEANDKVTRTSPTRASVWHCHV